MKTFYFALSQIGVTKVHYFFLFYIISFSTRKFNSIFSHFSGFQLTAPILSLMQIPNK